MRFCRVKLDDENVTTETGSSCSVELDESVNAEPVETVCDPALLSNDSVCSLV